MSSCDVCSPPIMLDIYMTINAQSHGDCKGRAPHLANHGAEPRPKGAELPQRLLQHGWEGEEAQGVARWSRIEDYHRIFHGLDIPRRSMRMERMKNPMNEAHFMISAKLIASSTPGMANARSCIMVPIIPFESAVCEAYMNNRQQTGRAKDMIRTLVNHLLYSARWVDLHREEVIEPVHFRGIFRELLAKCIRQIVCWIGRLYDHVPGI